MIARVAREMGIPRVLAFDLNAACSGWLYALEVGRALIRCGTAKNLIVVIFDNESYESNGALPTATSASAPGIILSNSI